MPGPSISIVTVCLNQAATIADAIESVLGQVVDPSSGGVEYIVVDGGSTDGTCEIIARYADRLAWWVSQPDRGQSHALNKGFARARGEILGWLNADDLLLPGALATVQSRFESRACDVLCGACRYDYPDGRSVVRRVTAGDLAFLDVHDPIHQPSCFWRRRLHEQVGGLDESLHYGMDWDLFWRMARAGARLAVCDEVLSVYRVTGVNKTSVGGRRRNRELYGLLRRHQRDPEARLLTEVAYRVLWPLKRLRGCRPRWLCRPVSDAARSAALVALGPMFGFDRVRRCTHPFA